MGTNARWSTVGRTLVVLLSTGRPETPSTADDRAQVARADARPPTKTHTRSQRCLTALAGALLPVGVLVLVCSDLPQSPLARDGRGVSPLESTVLASSVSGPQPLRAERPGAGPATRTSIALTAAQPAPSCSVLFPTAGSVSGTFRLDAAAANTTHVEYYLNGVDLGPGLPTMYGWLYSPDHGHTYGWDSASVANGSYVITCAATTDDGQRVTSSPDEVSVSNRIGCQVLIPNGGQSPGRISTLAATAPSGTTRLIFYLHSSLEADVLPGPGSAVATIYGWLYSPDGGRTYGWDSQPLPDGSSTVTCEASEPNGTALTSSPIAFTLSNSKRIIIYGDSLSAQAYPFSSYLLSSGGKAKTVNHTFGGTAPCNFLSTMEADAGNTTEPPDAVIIQFSGNVSNCYSNNPTPESSALVADYRSDVQTAINAFAAHNIHVYLVGAPISSSAYGPPLDPNWDMFNQLYTQLAASDPAEVTFVDAGPVVEGPSHAFVQYLQCLYFETVCNGTDYGAPTGTNVVRQPDGVHFCPVQISGTSPCPVYSSGALRFAMGEIGQVSHDLGV